MVGLALVAVAHALPERERLARGDEQSVEHGGGQAQVMGLVVLVDDGMAAGAVDHGLAAFVHQVREGLGASAVCVAAPVEAHGGVEQALALPLAQGKQEWKDLGQASSAHEMSLGRAGGSGLKFAITSVRGAVGAPFAGILRLSEGFLRLACERVVTNKEFRVV